MLTSKSSLFLGINLSLRLPQPGVPLIADRHTQITDLVSEMCIFGNGNSACGTDRYPMSQGVQDIWVKQVPPTFISNEVQIVIHGSWVTLQDFILEVGYWNGPSRSVHLQESLWSHLHEWDAAQSGIVPVDAVDTVNRGHMPFWGLWSWLTRADVERSTKDPLQCLEITQPLITISQSQWASDGTLRAPRDSFVTQISTIDPGADKYKVGKAQLALRRVLNLAYCVVWVARETGIGGEMSDGKRHRCA